MLIVSYDFCDDKRRSCFAKFLKKYGRRLQYSVFEIKNSERILQNILNEIEYSYKPFFGATDSILIYKLCKSCRDKVVRYGYPAQEEKELVIFQ